MLKAFVSKDDWVFTQCIRKNGRLICRPAGKFFRFKRYAKVASKTQSSR
jgi:hypothetical protein